jgi:hypothetical protein
MPSSRTPVLALAPALAPARARPRLATVGSAHGAFNGQYVGALLATLVLPGLATATQLQKQLPFMPGEKITYRVQLNGFKNIGHATMTVTGPVDVRGTPTYLLRSQTKAGVGPLKAAEVTESWLDPVKMRSLRFHERERHLLSTREIRAEIYPDQERWTANNGKSGNTLSPSPLDELSFIYFLRTIPSAPDTVYTFDRHFEAARNPITVRVTRGDTMTTAVGAFPSVLMEMRVRDPRRYRGDGLIRVYLSNDKCRIPLRVESTVPGTGKLILTIESYVEPMPACEDHIL